MNAFEEWARQAKDDELMGLTQYREKNGKQDYTLTNDIYQRFENDIWDLIDAGAQKNGITCDQWLAREGYSLWMTTEQESYRVLLDAAIKIVFQNWGIVIKPRVSPGQYGQKGYNAHG